MFLTLAISRGVSGIALKPGDVVVGVLAGAVETSVRPAAVIASNTYLVERPDVLVGILITKLPKTSGRVAL